MWLGINVTLDKKNIQINFHWERPSHEIKGNVLVFLTMYCIAGHYKCLLCLYLFTHKLRSSLELEITNSFPVRLSARESSLLYSTIPF